VSPPANSNSSSTNTITPHLSTLDWNPTYRLVPSRFPPVGLFDRVASAEDLEAVFWVQGLTNPRLRQELGAIALVPVADRVFGHGSTPVMAAFCYLNAQGSRFSNGTWGVYYAASTLAVAVAEVSFHRARFLAATSQPALEVDMRSYVGHVTKPLHDLRPPAWQNLHDPNNYGPSQALAATLRAQQSWGIVYNSVRDPGGQCVAILRPPGVDLPVVQGVHVALCWDGQAMTRWYSKSDVAQLPRLFTANGGSDKIPTRDQGAMPSSPS
jgi:hypothetical protein